jgi:hypothetical protein
MLERPNPNPELDTALDLSRSDPEQAANVLRIAASYLRRQESLPTALAFFLAEAFEGAMRHASMVRGTQLLMNLNLVVPNRRQKANFEYVGMELERLLRAHVPKGKAVLQVAESFGISDASVKRKHTEYRTYKDNEAHEDSLDYEAELRHYAQQAVNLKSKKKIPSKRSKEAPPFALDKK